MRAQSRKKILALLKCLPLLVIMVLAAAVLRSGNRMTVEGLLSYTPNNKVLAAFAALGDVCPEKFNDFLSVTPVIYGRRFSFPAADCAVHQYNRNRHFRNAAISFGPLLWQFHDRWSIKEVSKVGCNPRVPAEL